MNAVSLSAYFASASYNATDSATPTTENHMVMVEHAKQ
jgi:hypothetical protein